MNLNATIFGQMISFILFLLFCMKYIWPPIISAIENRKQEIKNSLLLVQDAKKYLRSSKIEAKNQLKKAEEKAQTIIDEAQKKYTKILDQAKIDSKIEYEKVINLAKKEINTERKIMCEKLRKEFVQLVIDSAEKVIEHSINTKLNKNIIEKIISDF